MATPASRFSSPQLKSQFSSNAFNSAYGVDGLDSSSGLYQVAHENGLQKQADSILKLHSGESNTIFSGGVISDIFDVLNIAQYGVAGIIKGKGFAEGVKNRESFSDEDALGKFGLLGSVAGIALDIAIDPFTYIAPWSIARKVPGLAKGLNVLKEATIGKKVVKGIEGTEKTFETLEGGSKMLKQVGNKIVWMFGQDPIFKEAYEVMQRNIGVGVQRMSHLVKKISKLEQEPMSKLFTRDETGRMSRQSIEVLQRELSSGDFDVAKQAWDEIDNLGKELVDLGVLGKEKFEENLGKYVRNSYEEYELAAKKGLFKSKKLGITGTKARKEGLTEEMMKELGQIDNPSFLVGNTIVNMVRDVENARFFKVVNEKFSSNIPLVGFTKVSDTKKFQTSFGKIVELRGKVGEVNKQLKPLLSSLKATFKGDRELTSELNKIEKELFELSGKRSKELEKFFQEEQGVEKATKVLTAAEKTREGIKVTPSEDIKKVIGIQKRIEELASKSEVLTDINRVSVNDSFRILEKQISDLHFTKQDILEEIVTTKAGNLAGKYIPDSMAQYVNEVIAPGTPFGAKLIGEFKYMKVVFNPATHAKNVVSNAILNWWKLGIGPWNAYLYADGLKDIATKSKWYERAQKVGMGADTYAANELRGLLEDPAMANLVSKYGGTWSSVKKFMGNIYQEEENLAKLVAFKEMVKRGLKDDEAWKAAESATFNYAQVTPFIRQVRTALWGVPFITFPLKALPIAAETAVKHTNRVSFFGKFKKSIESLSDTKETEKERATEPAYIRDGFFVKLPIKDAQGRSAYFDLTYIIPFGDLMSGQIFERQIKRETQLKEGIPLAIASKNPAANLIKELMNNQDFFGRKVVLESDPVWKQISDITSHVTKTMAPPWLADQFPGGYDNKGVRAKTGFVNSLDASAINQKRNLAEELLKNVGFKVLPIDAEVQSNINEFNRKKALRSLLLEQGIVTEFSKVYQP